MRRQRLTRVASAVVIALLSGAIAVRPATADDVSDQEKRVNQVAAELERLHKKVSELNEEYLAYLNEKNELDAEIARLLPEISNQEAELASLQVVLGDTAVAKVIGGNDSALGPLFTDPTAISDSLQRDHLTKVAVNAGAVSTDDYETLLDDLADEKASLEDKQSRALELAQKAQDKEAETNAAAAEEEKRLAEAKAELGDLIDQKEQREAEESYRQYLAEQRAKAQAAASSSQSSGSKSSSSGGGSTAVAAGGGGSASAPAASPASSDDSGGSSAPPVSGRASVAINAALSQQGVPYRFAASEPGVAFDCSGLTAYAWGVAGVSLPHQSAAQYASLPHVAKEQAQPGDLIFYYTPISHVGLYLGGGAMIHAPQTGQTVSITTVNWGKVIGVARPG